MPQKPFFLALLIALASGLSLAETPAPMEKPPAYVVKKGDTLWKISKKIWKDSENWPLLYASNQDKIRNPNLIYPRQKLEVPSDLSKEELDKALQLALEKAESLSGKRHKGTLPEAPKKNLTASPEVSAKTALPASSQTAASLPVTAGENPSSPAATAASGPRGLSKTFIFIAALIVLAAGLFFWKRKSSEEGSPAQTPRPLSSFPEAKEPTPNQPPPLASYPAASQPPATPKPAFSSPPEPSLANPLVEKPAAVSPVPASPTEKPATTSPGPASSVEKPRTIEGTTSSINTPAPETTPTPFVLKPLDPPLAEGAPPSNPVVQAPLPSASPSPQAQSPENKPPDDSNPPSNPSPA